MTITSYIRIMLNTHLYSYIQSSTYLTLVVILTHLDVRTFYSHPPIHSVFSAGVCFMHSYFLRAMATQPCWSLSGTLLHFFFFPGTQYPHKETSKVYTAVKKKRKNRGRWSVPVEHGASGTLSLLCFCVFKCCLL